MCHVKSPTSERDAYRFTGAAGDLVRIRMREHDGDINPKVELFDADGQRLTNVVDSSDAVLEVSLAAAGSYSVLASDDTGCCTSPYDLSLQRLNVPAGALPIAYGQTADGAISRYGHWDVYQFDAAAGDVVRLRLREMSDFNPRLELFNAQGNRLRLDENFFDVQVEMSFSTGGTYYALVSDRDGVVHGASDAYRLTLRRLNPPVGARAISYGQTFTGTNTLFGVWDVFTFAAGAGDRVRVRMREHDGDINPKVELFDADGQRLTNVVDSSDAVLEVSLAAAGTYSILASDDTGCCTSPYDLSLQRLDVPAGALPISYVQTADGAISRYGQWNVYQFDVAAGDVVRLRLREMSDFNPRLELFNAQGNRLRLDENFFDVQVEMSFSTGGTYYALVSDRDGVVHGGSDAYRLTLQRLNAPVGARTISYGQTLTGTNTQFGVWDVFTFAAGAGDRVRVRMREHDGDIDPTLELFNESGQRLTNAVDSSDAVLEMSLSAAGSYYILASDDTGCCTSPYDLSLQRLNVPASAVPIAYGQTLSRTNTRFGGWDVFSFAAAAGDLVRIRMREHDGDIDPTLELFNESGQRLTNVVDSSDAVLEVSLTAAGSYYILASDNTGCCTSPYDLSLQRLNTPPITGTQIYTNGFEGTVTAEWSTAIVDTTPTGGRTFLGQFGNEIVSLNLTNIPAHTNITIAFELFVIQSWDGNDLSGGPDIWDLRVAGSAALLHTTFRNPKSGTQAYPDFYPDGNHPERTGAIENDTLGYAFFGDSVYRLVFSFAHSADSLQLDFSASGLQDLADESWGLGNVVVYAQ